jgi:methylmalonyl-CoA/ethylmalonyl-CoA epimerase
MEIHSLLQVAQRVENLDRAVAFYGEVLGLRLMARFDPPGLAFFDLGCTRLLLEVNAPSAMLYLAVPDVHEAVEHVRAAGVTVVSEPHVIHVDEDGNFGEPSMVETMAFIYDSEGNLVGLASRSHPAD